MMSYVSTKCHDYLINTSRRYCIHCDGLIKIVSVLIIMRWLMTWLALEFILVVFIIYECKNKHLTMLQGSTLSISLPKNKPTFFKYNLVSVVCNVLFLKLYIL